MPQPPTTSHARIARSRPAAVALLVLIVALSAREMPPRDDARPEDAGWPEVTAGEREAALVASAGMFDAGVAPALTAPVPAAPVPAAPVPAAVVRDMGGDVALDPPSEGVDARPLPDTMLPAPAGYPHPVQYLTVVVEGVAVPLAFMDVSPTGPVNGRAVVILHDRDGAGDAWASTVTALAADGYRVIVPDLVGHGLSGRAGAELPVETFAAHTAILLDSIGAPRVSVVGDGLGAEVAVRLAGANAGLVDRMALLRGARAVEPTAGGTLHDPVPGTTVPVLVVGGTERLEPLLLGFLGH